MMPKVINTSIEGVHEISSVSFTDTRGSFLNCYRILDSAYVECWGHRKIHQVNLSFTRDVGTVRGMHLQKYPHHEAKLVRCIRGRVLDVVVDLRPNSATWGSWHALELSPEANNALLIPEGCAHGFQVLSPDSELLYLHSGSWVPDAEVGVHCCDPLLDIRWPLPVVGLSPRDQSFKFLSASKSQPL